MARSKTSKTAAAASLLTTLAAATQPTSPANIFYAAIPGQQHPLGYDQLPFQLPIASSTTKTISSSSSSEDVVVGGGSGCRTTTTGDPVTITFGVTDPTRAVPTYALTTERQTLIYACDAVPSGLPLASPQTTTQILHLEVSSSHAPGAESDRTTTAPDDVETTWVTNTWAQYPPGPSLARWSHQLGTRCECPVRKGNPSGHGEGDDGGGWEPDPRCEDQGLQTGCSVQCGFFRGRYTCLVGSDNPREFFEGRVCFGGGRLEYLGEPCHIGDVMMHCDECE